MPKSLRGFHISTNELLIKIVTNPNSYSSYEKHFHFYK